VTRLETSALIAGPVSSSDAVAFGNQVASRAKLAKFG
jgi:hypothetical protein